MKTTTLDKATKIYNQLSHATFSDPFSFIGPFLGEQGALRVWMPGADKVELVIDDQRIELEREDASGFILKQERDLQFSHYLLAVDWDGTEQLIDDPYQ